MNQQERQIKKERRAKLNPFRGLPKIKLASGYWFAVSAIKPGEPVTLQNKKGHVMRMHVLVFKKHLKQQILAL